MSDEPVLPTWVRVGAMRIGKGVKVAMLQESIDRHIAYKDTRIKELEAAFARAEKLSRYYFKQCQKHWPQRVISDE